METTATAQVTSTTPAKEDKASVFWQTRPSQVQVWGPGGIALQHSGGQKGGGVSGRLEQVHRGIRGLSYVAQRLADMAETRRDKSRRVQGEGRKVGWVG